MRNIKATKRGLSLSFGHDTPQNGERGSAAAETKKRPLWPGKYRVDIHGKNDDEILAEINRLEIHHEKKSARMTAFQPLIGEYVEIAGQLYLWTDCAIRERGTNVELYASVWDPWGKRPKCMPLRIVYPTIDDVPANEEIEQMVRERIASFVAKEMAEQQKIERVQELLSLAGEA